MTSPNHPGETPQHDSEDSTDADPGSGDSTKQSTLFRMEVKQQHTNANRKRKRALHSNADPFGDKDEDATGSKHQQKESLTAVSASPTPSEEATVNSGTSEATVKANNNSNSALAAGGEKTTVAGPPSSTTAKTATATSSSIKKDKLNQPDGWRVKLYRLNADGSWDDCGTGRVLCLYRPASTKANAKSPMPILALNSTSANNNDNAVDGGAPAQQQISAALDAWICQELGEPTLCMHAEVPPAASEAGGSPAVPPRILLRTRILLRDAYQRQGDNIITWCEPYYDNNNTLRNSVNAARRADDNPEAGKDGNNNAINAGGVDLALSFQDNAGCLDIWRQITHVQRRAAELYRTHQQQQTGQPSSVAAATAALTDRGETDENEGSAGNNNAALSDNTGSGGDNDGRPDASGESVTDVARRIAQDHHAELDRQHQHEMWVSMAGTIQHTTRDAFGEGGDASSSSLSEHFQMDHQQQHYHVNVAQHNNSNMGHHVHHHTNANTGNANLAVNNPGTANKQQQHHHHHLGDAQQHQQQQHHAPFGSGDDGTTDMYGNGASSPNHQQDHANLQNNPNNALMSPQLPSPPTLSNLEEIADTIARVQHIQQRENLAMFISQNECSYLKSLLLLFPTAEARGDYGSLATLAACVKTILLLNEPSILELIVSDEVIFEEVCATLEYDPDLRDKANHRWFLRERARFRTVVLMEDEELVAAIHRAFRVNYLRDTLLRPTMDESSLSTLSSLQTFTHADVVKGVTISPPPPQIHNGTGSLTDGHGHENGHHNHGGKDTSALDSYLVRVIRVLGVELHALCHMEWTELESKPVGSTNFPGGEELPADHSIVVSSRRYGSHSERISDTWQQHLAPQDGSLASRRIRRRGCLTFLRELFNMVRISLQQSDKDNFFSVIVSMEIEVLSGDDTEKGKISDNESQTSKIVEVGSVAASEKSERFDEKGEGILSQHLGLDFLPLSTPVNLLSLLGTVLSDPNTDVTEKGLVLEIIAGVAMHDPGLIRRHCLEFHSSWKRNQNHAHHDRDVAGLGRPEANEKKQVIFLCPPNDLLAALLFLLDAETDAGILLQVSEIMRIILDTDMMGEHGPMGAGFADEAEHGVFTDESEGLPPGNGGNVPQPHEQHNQIMNGGSTATTTEQKQFLSMFYEHFIDWVVAPFQFTILHPVRRVPDTVLISPSGSPLLIQMMKAFKDGVTHDDGLFRIIPRSAIRASFAVELLSFCVRAHLYRMKIFLLKSRVLSSVLKLLKPPSLAPSTSSDKCLKLAALRFLRAILSVNDEFYHRHIIHHNLFAPVFETFRANPVGDNLVSSAIVEMCDFIHNENIMSLMEYIVTKHLAAAPHTESPGPSLEDVSSPYVSTLTTLRESYEQNLEALRQQHQQQGKLGPSPESPRPHSETEGSSYFSGKPLSQAPRVLSGKALEDQRKFREEHDEESYFEDDDDDEVGPQPLPPSNTSVPLAVDEVAAQENEADLRNTGRDFALAQTSLMNHTGPSLRPEDNATKENLVSQQAPHGDQDGGHTSANNMQE